MSRHEIQGRNPGDRIVLGWDQPMSTYFVHIFLAGSETRGEPDLWIGDKPRELYDLEALQRLVRPYAVISSALAATLCADRDEGR